MNHSALKRMDWNEQDCLGSPHLFLLTSDISMLGMFETFCSRFTYASNFLIKMRYCDPRVYWTVKLNHISSFEIAKLPPLDFPENLYWGKSQNEYVGKDATEYSWETGVNAGATSLERKGKWIKCVMRHHSKSPAWPNTPISHTLEMRATRPARVSTS